MKKILMLLFFCHVSSPVRHSLEYIVTASMGVPNIPEFMGAAMFDGLLLGSCDTKKVTVNPKLGWIKTLLEYFPEQMERYVEECTAVQPHFFRATLSTLKQRFNQSGGVHILQRMRGCEWDDETGEVNGFMQFGYNGEDFIALDLKTWTWIAPKPQAVVTKLRWDADKARLQHYKNDISKICPDWIEKFLAYGKSSLLRTERPSVSLLQKSPSSPVSCHATGFYPDRAMMFWRKDGEEIHEDVDLGEILPNHDGSFQMSVDLDVSSVAPEDWSRYDCVFHLSGLEEDIVTKLDKAAIRTNWEKSSDRNTAITAAVSVLAVVLMVVTGVTVYKKKTAECPPCPPDNMSELSQKLNSKT
ncbi:major histocompatibility complex class I-related gene protein-like [Plectropomus leopardus]|uniref:major histocompatibility complex class I-related gene protein-like n=1 Tax=Plectropomus leopardus TaxID=160734 RepID=UPI001C4DADA8|nr:major histocompatibility complex class I-related gene protein-like [Plectropomus leopardus]